MTTPESSLVTPAVLPPGFDDPSIPRIAVEPVESCVLCGSREWNPFADGFDYELRTCRNRWHFVACAQCDHVRLHPRPRADTLGIIYPPTYYAYNYDTQVSPLALKAKAWMDRRKFAGIIRYLPRAPASFLDVGCGNGRFLDLMAGQGLARERIHGIELDQPTVDRLRERGYQAWCQRVEECEQLPANGIDLATMFHVIEHVDQPLAVVTRLAKCLTSGGILALETPNLDSWDARLFKEHFWGGYHIPRHWHLFTPRTITRLLNKAGFDVVSVEYQTGHSFWMYSFHHRLRYGTPPRPKLAARFDPMGGSLLALAAVTGFDKLRAAFGATTSAMLIIARKPE